jgi:hypothetical protein
MTIDTTCGIPVDARALNSYLRNLVNLFFKILPIREAEEPSLKTYMESLQAEILGCKALVKTINADSMFLTLVSILQYLIDRVDNDVLVFKREVFKAISICNKLKARYAVIAEREGE